MSARFIARWTTAPSRRDAWSPTTTAPTRVSITVNTDHLPSLIQLLDTAHLTSTSSLAHRLERNERKAALRAPLVGSDEEVLDRAAKEVGELLRVVDGDGAEASAHNVADVGLNETSEGDDLGLRRTGKGDGDLQ